MDAKAILDEYRLKHGKALDDLRAAESETASASRRLEEAKSREAVCSATVKERAEALEAMLALVQASQASRRPGTHETRAPRVGHTREKWGNIIADMPTPPNNGLPVSAVYEIARRHDPNLSDANIRSQLNALKKRGKVELVESGWRAAQAAAPDTSSASPKSEGTASDEESSGVILNDLLGSTANVFKMGGA